MGNPHFFLIHNNPTSLEAALKAGFTLSDNFDSSSGAYCEVSVVTKNIYHSLGVQPRSLIIYPQQLLELGLLPDSDSRVAYLTVLQEEYKNEFNRISSLP